MRRANGEGSIVKLGGKRRKPYGVRITTGWTPEGKQTYKYLGYYSTKTEAKKNLNEFLINPYDLDNKNLTLIDVYEKWKVNSDISERTMDNYKSAFNRAKPLHKMSIRELKIYHLEEIMNDLSPHMKKVFKHAMTQIFNYAEKYEIVDRNPMRLVTVKDTAIPEKQALTIEDINKIKSFKHEYSHTSLIMLHTGMRVAELLMLENENIFLEERYMVTGVKTEAGKNRVIPIHNDILDLIKKHYDPNKKFFINYLDKQMAYNMYRKHYWNLLREATGLEITPHHLRHTFATFGDRVGMNRVAMKRIMGHTLKDVTEHYTHKDLSELLTEINKIKY